MNQMEIRRNIGSCTQKIGRAFPEPDVLPVFVNQSLRRNCLPLPFPIDPFTDADRQFSCPHTLLNQILPAAPACQQHITV